MQLLWLLPGLGFGLILGFTTGQWMMASFALATFVLLAIGLLVRQNQIPIKDADEIHWGIRRVAIGNRKLSRFTWFWKPEIRQRLVSAVLSENQQRMAQLKSKNRLVNGVQVEGDRKALTFFCGFSNSVDLEIDLVEQGPHAFISGPTGSGKSQFLQLMLTSLTQTYSSDQLQLVTIDYKGGATLGRFDALASTTDLQSNQAEVFAYLTNVLAEREAMLAEKGLSRIEQASDAFRLVVAVDELAAVLQVRGALECLEAIAARGRSLGVHLVATAQSTSGIARSLLVNLGLRVSTGRVDPLELAQLGFKPMQKTQLAIPGMIFAQLQGASMSCEFSFPILEMHRAGQAGAPPANQIQLLR
ncbi:MAG: FtsK/SpoIIIE domain-containing protein [Micrococcales bacterium]